MIGKGLVVAGVGALMVTQACSDSASVDPIRSCDQAVLECSYGDGAQVTMAALAVAMGTELGQIDPLRQLQIGSGPSGERLELRPGMCPEGCPRTRALLDLQDAALDDFPQNTFSATRYRTELVAKYREQIAQELQNPHTELPADHRLVFAGETDLGGCGLHTIFDVVEPDCQKGSNCNAYTGDVTLLESRLWAFGGVGNPFLDVRTDGSQILIDPDYADTGTISTGCNCLTCDATALCRIWDPDRERSGCCTCDGVSNGTWQRYSRNANYAICRP